MNRLTRIIVALPVMLTLGGCEEHSAPSDTEQRALSAERLVRGARTPAQTPTPVLPEVVPSSSERKALERSQARERFMNILYSQSAHYVLEGTIVSATADLVENNVTDQLSHWIVVTRYQLSGRSWNRSTPGGEFWVLGGTLSGDVPPSNQYPRAQRYSHETYPEVGDRVIVAVKNRPFLGAGTAPMVAWDSDGVVRVSGPDAMPEVVVNELRSKIDGFYSK
jgi:hypothetical protein